MARRLGAPAAVRLQHRQLVEKADYVITVGIDAGLEALKVAVIRDRYILAEHSVLAAAAPTAQVAERALETVCSRAGLRFSDAESIVATGMFAPDVPFATEQAGEAACVARGIGYVLPSARTVLDIGAGKCFAVSCQDGRLRKVSSNDKCAAGAGRYLRAVSDVLAIPIERTGQVALQSQEEVTVCSTCAVFAESEIVSLVHLRRRPEDILMGVFRGLAARMYTLLLTAGIEDDLCLVGGVAKNEGMVRAIEAVTMRRVLVPSRPEMVAATGAALLAQEQLAAA